MKIKYFLLSFILLAVILKAQEYPTISIPELNIVPDSILTNATTISDIGTQHMGDTVKIVGTVLFAPMVDWENDRRLTTSSASRGTYVTFIQDTSGALWGGMFIEQPDTNIATGFDIIDTGDVVEITGVVSEGFYGNTTTFTVLVDPLTEINLVDSKGKMPDPIVVTIPEFFDGSAFNLEAEKYEGMYIEFQNVTTSDRNPNGSTNFAFSDGSGNKIFMYDQSSYFTERTHKLVGITQYESPADGTLLEHIRGILHTRDDGWYLVPLYPGDMKVGITAPATISLIENTPARVLPNESAAVKYDILDNDGTVEEAKLFYQVDGGAFTEVVMTLEDTVYSATIPAINSDSSFVSYFIYAKDNDGNESLSPTDTANAFHYYWVLNSDPTIFHVQYTPYRGGASRFEGETITLQGIVTADSNSIDGGAVQYMQQPGLDEWAGIRLIKTPPNGQVRGDLISVTGTLIEDFYHTTLDVTDLVIEEHIGEITPLSLTCDQISIGRNDLAEEYESMLLTYNNVTVTSESADGTSNFGEILISDATGSTRVELQDGNHNYHNNWDVNLADSTNLIEINEGNTFESITGVLYYSFSNFKIIPRSNDDFVGHITEVKELNVVPEKYNLAQNYPNPFNPSTIIKYSIPNVASNYSSSVLLKVYDIIGREVATLVNQNQNPGNYEVSFDASDLTSGIYFYTIKTGSFYQAKKMMLIK
jgi:Secretion system C-terminal sorting domain